jgi:hypothetical protein
VLMSSPSIKLSIGVVLCLALFTYSLGVSLLRIHLHHLSLSVVVLCNWVHELLFWYTVVTRMRETLGIRSSGWAVGVYMSVFPSFL